MPAAPEELVGQIIDRKYRIENLLGRGGMGAVFRATHLGTSRVVAVKVIAPRFAEEPEFLQRFQREAHACGRLRHPNIVDVTDFGVTEHDGGRLAYLVMEYLDGCTLAEVLRSETRLPLPWSIDVLDQVSSAVDEAHRNGILHRDLKPENIWLEPNRRGGYTVKVLDFGLAKQAGGAPVLDERDARQNSAPPVIMGSGSGGMPPTLADADTTTVAPSESTRVQQPAARTPAATLFDGDAPTMARLDPNPNTAPFLPTEDGVTRAGSVVGTPAYMSPEQVLGRVVTPRSDIYSLGVIAYLMIGGQPPFSGSSDQILASHVRETPRPIRELRPDLPQEAADHLMSALAKDPEARPSSALAFVAKLSARFETPTAFLHGALQIFVAHIGAWLRLSILCFLPLLVLSVALSATVALSAAGALDLSWLEARSATLPLAASVALVTLCFVALGGAVVPVALQAVAAPLRPVAIEVLLRSFAGRFKAWLRELAPLLVAGLGLLAVWPFLPMGLDSLADGLAPYARTLWLPLRILLALTIMGFVFSVPVAVALLAIRRLGGAKAFQFLGPVMLVEGLTGPPARVRSSFLFDQAGRALQPLQILIMIASGVLGALASLASNLSERFLAPLAFGGMIAPMVAAALAVSASFLSLVGALTYLRARRAAGEPLDRVLADFERSVLPKDSWQLTQRDQVRKQISLTR